jgi:cytochrome c5
MNFATLASFFLIINGLLTTACGSNSENQILSTTQTNAEAEAEAEAEAKAEAEAVIEVNSNTAESSKKSITSPITWDTGASKIFANNCGFCHTNWALNFELFKSKKVEIIQRINSTTKPMPPTNTPKWLNDKERALEYLDSAEMN